MLFVILATGILALVGTGYIDVGNAAKSMHKDTKSIKTNKLDTLKGKNVSAKIGILVLGVDNDREREATTTVRGKRSDTMMYVVYDGKDKTISMTTVPRDTYTTIYDEDGNPTGQDKINAAFSYGGVDGSINTFKKTFGLPVDYYATVDFISFKKIVDAVGGVKLTVPYDIGANYEKDYAVTNPGKTILKKGTQNLNGEQALIFARIRKYDDDIKRGQRQQQVMKAVIKKVVSINSIDRYQDILDSVKDDVETNLTFQNMEDLASGMVDFKAWKMNSYTFKWTSGTLSDGSSVVFLTDATRDYIVHKMKVNLGMEDPDERDAKGYKVVDDGTSTEKFNAGAQ